MNISHLAIAITFHYTEKRLEYLSRITAAHRSLAERVTTFIITNANTAVQIDKIKDYSKAENLTIVRPTHIGHPFLLTWCHRSVFMNLINSDSSVTHFLYTEDDILFTLDNLNYWLTLSPVLREHNGIPGFIRYEKDSEGSLFSTDFTRPLFLDSTFSFWHNETYLVCLTEPYQALYLLDRDQMHELLDNEAGSPDDPSTFGRWGIREKASQGLAFWKKDDKYPSNYFIKVNHNKIIDSHALVHHLANTYAQISNSPYGKISINNCIQDSPPIMSSKSVHIWGKIKTICKKSVTLLKHT
jgi:hypothetical protein